MSFCKDEMIMTKKETQMLRDTKQNGSKITIKASFEKWGKHFVNIFMKFASSQSLKLESDIFSSASDMLVKSFINVFQFQKISNRF